MRLRTALAASAAFALTAIALAPAPLSIPVSWTPALAITQADLDDVPAFLAKPVPMGGNGEGARPTLSNPKGEDRVVRTGFDWLDARDLGFSFKSNADNKMESWYRERVLGTLWVSKAKPSRKSYLAELRPDASVVKWFPAALGFDPKGDEARELAEKLKREPTWTELYPKTQVKLMGDHTVDLFDGDNAHTYVTFLARGDVTGDGIEDLLLSVTHGLDLGTWHDQQLVTISRRHPKLPIVISDTQR